MNSEQEGQPQKPDALDRLAADPRCANKEFDRILRPPKPKSDKEPKKPPKGGSR